MGIRAEEDSGKLSLTDQLLNAVLAKAKAVCVGLPMSLTGLESLSWVSVLVPGVILLLPVLMHLLLAPVVS